MSDFASLRERSYKLLERMVEELENKSEFTSGDAGVIEKVVKTCVILETQAAKNGTDTGLKDLSAEDLEAAYDGD